MTNHKLSDNSIYQIVRLIQLGIITGTDVSDQLRTFELTIGDNGKLDPSPGFLEVFEDNLARLQKDAETTNSENTAQ